MRVAIFALIIVVAAIASSVQTQAVTLGPIRLRDAAGAEVGIATIGYAGRGLTRVEISVYGLTPGFHGFHVHGAGLCAPPFTSAGGHHNPAGGSHPGHAGDMPVLLVTAGGTGAGSVLTDRFSVASLLDADGSALIIHANPDNYANIPTDRYDPDPDATTLATGDAGARVACGVIAPAAP